MQRVESVPLKRTALFLRDPISRHVMRASGRDLTLKDSLGRTKSLWNQKGTRNQSFLKRTDDQFLREDNGTISRFPFFGGSQRALAHCCESLCGAIIGLVQARGMQRAATDVFQLCCRSSRDSCHEHSSTKLLMRPITVSRLEAGKQRERQQKERDRTSKRPRNMVAARIGHEARNSSRHALFQVYLRT